MLPLAEELYAFVEHHLDALASGPLPDLVLPRLLLGHEVGPDVRADLLFTLGFVHASGRRDLTEPITRLLAGVHGKRTTTFYSYRVCETAARFGTWDDNPVLTVLTDAQREQVALATDSSDWIALLDDGRLPRNYAAVLARCEHARSRLGLPHARLDDLLERVGALLGGHLDDSTTQIGRYDIYTADIHLFCEPMADRLGERWRAGTRAALDLVDRVATRDGTAVPWGRSTGVLALCHTIELGALVSAHDLVDDPGRWTARAADAARHLDGWFDDGWATAHQHRSSDPYRGLDRRLQLTLDCLGKLANAAHELRAAAPAVDDLFPRRDEIVWLDRARHAGAWAYRSGATDFVLPIVGGSTSDYVPAPRNPGLFEHPVGSPLVTGTPMVLHRGLRFAGAGLPVALDHAAGIVHARYEGFPEAGHLEAAPSTFAGTRDVTWRVDGRSVVTDEALTFDVLPHGVSLQVAEAHDRPLVVTFSSDDPHTTATVDVDGIAEYRSCWGELRRLHQIDLEPAPSISFRWTATPVLRIVSTAAGHHYNDALYAPMGDRVHVERLPHSAAVDPTSLIERTDVFHLHWPEWLTIQSSEQQQHLIDALRAAGTRIVWTQHNLVAHSRDPRAEPLYRAWAEAADLVVHHSEWGKGRALATYEYGPQTRHVVIAHGHFGGGADVAPRRAGATVTLGIIGAPRIDKDVDLVVRAFARVDRDDLRLVVWSLDGDDGAPADPRIDAHRYEMVDRALYDERLADIDALLMPFDPDGAMLTTGTIGDALGFGIPTIASSWPYLVEALGDAAIVYGSTEDDLVACLESLDRADLDRAADAAVARRAEHDWSVIAEQTWAELDRL